MDLKLKGRTAVVSGASRGLGRAIALALADEGMDVALVARDRDRIDGVQREIEAKGGRALPIVADLTEPAAAGRAIDAAVAGFGKLDLLVNNAGATKRNDFLALTDADWHEGFELKFFGYVRMARAAWPYLKRSRGTIVNIAGVGGRTGSAEFTIGGSVNSALMLLTKALSDRGVADGVRVNAINPGSIETERLGARVDRDAERLNLSRDEARSTLLKDLRIARFGRADEIGSLVAILASERTDFVRGALIDADGGETRSV